MIAISFLRGIKPLAVALVFLGGCLTHAVGQDPVSTEMEAIFRDAQTDPTQFRRLANLPPEHAFPLLRTLWSDNLGLYEQRQNARKHGVESEWIATQKRIGRDPDAPEKIFPIARDILLSDVRWEGYMEGELSKMLVTLKKADEARDLSLLLGTDPAFRREYFAATTHFPYHMGFAKNIPTNLAFRLTGEGLSAPHHPPIDHGDVTETSLAASAYGTLKNLAHDRLGEELPNTIEGARAWWQTNKTRFVSEPKVPKSADGSSAPAAATPESKEGTDRAPEKSVTQATQVTTSPSSFSLIVGALACILGALGILLFWQRQNRQRGSEK